MGGDVEVFGGERVRYLVEGFREAQYRSEDGLFCFCAVRGLVGLFHRLPLLEGLRCVRLRGAGERLLRW